VVVISKPFRPIVKFVGKARAYPSEALSKCSTLGLALGLTHKNMARSEWLAWDTCSSLVQKIVNYRQKEFYNVGPWPALEIVILRALIMALNK
jgi:hypothetical protein